jgi:excisionase family DNA binding protein
MTGMDTLLTVRQLQDLLQVDRITIYRMLDDGRLRGFKVGGQWRFSRQAIESWLQEQQASLRAIEPPEASGASSPSPDVLPLSCIQAIQDIFAQALGIAAVTTALDGTPITSIANSCRFCNLILNTKAGQQRCVASWRLATAEPGPALSLIRGSTPPLAACHAGLHYVWGRIEVQGQFIAAVYAGQFLDRPDDRESQPVRLAEVAGATGLQVQELQAALGSVPVLDRERQQQVHALLQRVAATFSEIGAERLSLLGRLRRIAEMTQL